jgi:SHS2 domain-containing protein
MTSNKSVPPSAGFEEVEHTADLALRVRGNNLAELFKNAGRGMAHLMAPAFAVDPPPAVVHPVSLHESDTESLLVEWLSEMAYLAETRQLVFHRFEIHEITATSLKAILHGTPAAEFQKAIKAVTFHDLEIRRTDGGFETTVVFDV